jgi:DegV family protein with EDD domain
MVKIISDSTSDLSQELLDRYDITLVPLIVRLGDQQYEDRVNITSEEIFDWSNSTKKAPTTACANAWSVQECFKKYLASHDEIVAFTISSSMSATYANMVEAAAELGASKRVHVIDSRNLSTGIGLLVLEAAEMAQAGKSGADIVAHVESLIPSVRASFVVDTLTFLHRGGRCSGAAALAGSVLKLHPKIIVKDGKMSVDKKYRGSLAHAISTYTADLHDDLLAADKKRVFITHSGCDREIVEQVRTYLTALHHFDEVIETRAGGVISCHCGPGTLGVLFVESAK